jgi:hypothetical protein
MPITRCFLATGLLAVLALSAIAAESAIPKTDAEAGFVSMFNGKDLTGWEGLPGRWEVRDGLIVCESTAEKPGDRTHYLYWKGGQPADFEMRCAFRIAGAANTGVQFRSETRPNFDTWGYQADIDAAGQYVGCFYQHGRGLVAQRGQKVVIDAAGKKTITPIGDAAELLKAVKKGDWNELRLVATGSRMAYWLNGVLMCEVEDHEPKYALPKGVIALQMHKGPPMKAEFKDLRIRVVK